MISFLRIQHILFLRYVRWVFLSTVLVAAVNGCARTKGKIESAPLARRPAEVHNTLFERLLPDETGIDFVGLYPEQSTLGRRLLATAFTGCGVCIGDYDKDGLPDIYLTRHDQGCRLFRNLGGWRFQDVTDQAGVSGEGRWCSGPSFADLNNDGHPDLYVGVYNAANLLYINKGDGTFEEQGAEFGLAYTGGTVMPAVADYDCDGDLDIYILTNQNYHSEQAQRKEDIQKATQVTGNLGQLFVFGAAGEIFAVSPDYADAVKILRDAEGKVHAMAVAEGDRLLRNNNDGTFSDVTGECGFDSESYFGLSATWWDYNDDGWPDLYVANDFTDPDILYKNNGDGTFSDVTREALPHTPWYSMGSAAGDLNNDGRVDFMATDMSGTSHYKQKVGMGDMGSNAWFLTSADPRQYMRNAVYLNTGTERFMEVAYLTNLSDTDWSWSTKLADLDNDGRIDVFVTNGMSRDFFNSDLQQQAGGYGTTDETTISRYWLKADQKRDANLAFRNQSDLQFENVTESWGLDHEGVSYGAAWADLDCDGDLDLIVNNYNDQVGLYRNLDSTGHRVVVRLQGIASNKLGLGAKLIAETPTQRQVRHLSPASGFMSADEPIAHFGLGDETTIDRLTIHWPSGHVQSWQNLTADRLYNVTEPSNQPPAKPGKTNERGRAARFRRSDRMRFVYHRETPHDDFAEQPLLPNKLSQLGPGLAWGDFDGDGREDMFVGGAAGHVARLLRNDRNGFHGHTVPLGSGDANPFSSDEECEDLGAVFFDADVDGDLDLYVVSGSNEHAKGDAHLEDRLYLNDSQGRFSKAPSDALPAACDSGSVVAAADFDRDGDVDLFVGGRVIPGRYPETPESRLLRNDSSPASGPEFRDVTDRRLRFTGMVTSAVWSDADGDGWPDLLITHEWGPVKFFRNENGTLHDRTHEAGLLDTHGWWNGIASRDVDGDGDMDFAVSNFGLNTKYHASDEHPVAIYYGDFDGTGRKRVIEAEYESGILYPVRGRSCSSSAIPLVGHKFASFREFAVASLPELYTPECLNEAKRLHANCLESGILINDGDGRFTFRALPRIAQVAPAFGIVLTEVDGDGHPDVYLVHNFFGPQHETGRMDGGVSLLLLGNGDGTFRPQWPSETGLLVAGDAKSLTTADVNQDGWVDFVVGVNDAELVALENLAHAENRTLAVRLIGRGGNPTAIGARVSVEPHLGVRQTAEVTAGGGYLSQSSSVLVFGLGPNSKAVRIVVRWPDSRTTLHECDRDAGTIQIAQPILQPK